MTSFRLKEEKRCLHVHWSLQPTHFLKDWMPIFIVDPVKYDDQKANFKSLRIKMWLELEFMKRFMVFPTSTLSMTIISQAVATETHAKSLNQALTYRM